jgi:hypothetical protein
MAEILLNSQSPVTHQIFWNGDIAIPEDDPVVKLFDITNDPAINPPINPSTLMETLTAVADETNPGSYSVYIPFQYTNRNRTLRLKWEYYIGDKFVSREDEVFVVTPYVDFNHIEDLGVSIDPSDPNYKSYKELCRAEKYARKRIEEYTHQKFYLYDESYSITGYNSDTLPLPAKIYDLHELYANDILLVDNIQSINNWNYNVEILTTGYGLRINRAAMMDNTVYTANGMVPPSIHDTSGIFRSDTTYEVNGRFGWEKVPDNVELAGIELMKDYFSNDTNWKNNYIKNMSTFDWDFEYNSDVFRGTGNAYADKLLANYVLSGAAII